MQCKTKVSVVASICMLLSFPTLTWVAITLAAAFIDVIIIAIALLIATLVFMFRITLQA